MPATDADATAQHLLNVAETLLELSGPGAVTITLGRKGKPLGVAVQRRGSVAAALEPTETVRLPEARETAIVSAIVDSLSTEHWPDGGSADVLLVVRLHAAGDGVEAKAALSVVPRA